jgi:hypothetical protein
MSPMIVSGRPARCQYKGSLLPHRILFWEAGSGKRGRRRAFLHTPIGLKGETSPRRIVTAGGCPSRPGRFGIQKSRRDAGRVYASINFST